jgi:hypothetical protein
LWLLCCGCDYALRWGAKKKQAQAQPSTLSLEAATSINEIALQGVSEPAEVAQPPQGFRHTHAACWLHYEVVVPSPKALKESH